MYHWGRESATSFKLFLQAQIFVPTLNIYNSIFKTFQARPASISGPEELRQNKEALASMLEEFGRAQSRSIAAHENKSETVFLNELPQRAASEDMSIVMDVYTEDIKRPLKSILYGNLLEGLLIQIQKVKIDGQAAMVTLDQLLRANEITFELLTIIPAVILLGAFGIISFRTITWLFTRRSPHPLYRNLRLRMHRIQHILVRCGTFENNPDGEDLNTGRLLLELDYMAELVESLPHRESRLILRDLRLLAAQSYSTWQKHLIVGQMYHFYPYLVRPRTLIP